MMITLSIIGLICILVLSFGLSKIIVNPKEGAGSPSKTLLQICTGIIVTMIMIVLSVIAIWPPFELLTAMLPLIFIVVLIGISYFRNKATEKNQKAYSRKENKKSVN